MFRQSAFASAAFSAFWPAVFSTRAASSNDDLFVSASIGEEIACELAGGLSDLGFDVRSILPHGVALSTGATALTGIDPQAVVYLDPAGSLVTVCHGSQPGYCRNLVDLPNPLRSTLIASEQPDVWNVASLRPWLNEISEQITATIRFAHRGTSSPKPEQPILLAGRLAEVPGVSQCIADRTRLPIATWRFAGDTRPLPSHSQCTASPAVTTDPADPTDDVRYATALSLAYAATRCDKNGFHP